MTSSTLLRRLALHRPELRAWALYDCANSAFWTTIIAAVFPIYYSRVAAAGLEPATASFRFAASTTIGLTAIALVAPILGALADFAAIKKKMLAAFLGLGVVATALMFFIREGDWLLASTLFVLGNIGAAASLTFYDSLLPHVAGPDEVDRVSTSGYALGYLGGGVLLAVNLAWITRPDVFGLPDAEVATRIAFASVAVWWLAFSIPIFRTVQEPARTLEADERGGEHPLRVALTRIGETLGELRRYRHTFLMLLAFLLYNDGINTIIRMATIYGTEIGLPQNALILALLIVQFVGIPCAVLFGQLAARIGAKQAIMIALATYLVICVLAYGMTTATDFFVLAVLVGTVQGGSQALSRSLFASMVPRHKSSEFFGFFGVFEKFAGILGPAVFAAMIWVTGSSRNAILALIFFFVAGALLLWPVDVAEGQRVAREADAGARVPRTA